MMFLIPLAITVWAYVYECWQEECDYNVFSLVWPTVAWCIYFAWIS